MASEIDICNLALGHLGDEATVSSIHPPEGSAQAEHCARFYSISRDQLLAMHAWSFATKRISLALLTTTELPASWQFAYARPSGCLQAVSVLMPASTDDTDTQDFVEETLQDGTQVIYTNVSLATFRYINVVTDTTRFTPLFVIACARLLASYVAGPLIKGNTGMKVSGAHLELFRKIDAPAAMAADSRGRKANLYGSFTPAGIKARA